MKTLYLDHAATTPIDDETCAYMQQFWSKEYGNPSSMYASGRRAAHAITEARERIARCIGASSDEVIFTGSGTESDNLAVIGAARAYSTYGKHVIISAVEHKAVLEAAYVLEKEGFAISVIPVDAHGMIDVASVISAIREDTTLISVMLANNEIGTIQPIAELTHAVRNQNGHSELPFIHTDACQAAGHLPLDVGVLGVDLMSLNGSKVYGPKGIGVLYKRNGVRLSPVLVGGGQESGVRAGTESVPLIMGMAHALEKAMNMHEKEHERLLQLRSYFISGLQVNIPDIIVNGHPTLVLPHIVHVTVPSIEGESMVLMLDAEGIETATGSACSANDLRPSHVLTAIGQDDDLIHGSVRFSFGRSTTQADLAYALSVFPSIVNQLKNMSVLTSRIYAREKYIA